MQTDFYKNTPNLEMFEYAVKNSKNPLCYNGDICTKEEYETICNRFPEVPSVMIGRGILKNPGLIRKIRQGIPIEKDRIRAFHNELYREYQEVLFQEKETMLQDERAVVLYGAVVHPVWNYAKKIKKAEKLKLYEAVVDALFEEQDLV